jgi:hypothetical protein
MTREKRLVYSFQHRKSAPVIVALVQAVASLCSAQAQDIDMQEAAGKFAGTKADAKSAGTKAGAKLVDTKSGSTTTVLTGHVNVLAGACASAGITIEATTLPTRITKVRIGSPAYYAGVAENDQVLQGLLGANTMQLRFERDHKQYVVNLRYNPDNLSPLAQKPAKVHLSGGQSHSQLRLAAEATKDADWKQLKQYDITVLLDSSGSMGAALSSVGESKWNWCQEEIYSLAQEAENLGHGTFDLCTFNSTYELTLGCNAEKSKQILSAIKFGGGTNLDQPLEDILYRCFRGPHQRPMLIVVITDGLMSNKGIENLLIDTAQKLKSPQEVRLLFLQIGDDPAGQRLAEILDHDLVLMGAPYDIVDSLNSDQLLQLGLRRGLITAMSRTKPAPATRSADDVRAELECVRAELARLRAETTSPLGQHGTPTGSGEKAKPQVNAGSAASAQSASSKHTLQRH